MVASARDCAVAAMRAHERALVEQVIEFEWARRSSPRRCRGSTTRPSSGSVRSRRPWGVPQLDRDAERLMGAVRLGHRRVNVDDEATASRLADAFTAAGWEHEQFLVMVLHRPPDRPPNVVAEEVDPRVLEDLHVAGMRSRGADDRLIEQLLARAERLRGVTGVRAFAVLEGGRPVAHAYLYRDREDGPVAQVEEVGTAEAHRGRGYGRAVVVAAAEAQRTPRSSSSSRTRATGPSTSTGSWASTRLERRTASSSA
jgi:hypothetical protein